MEPDKALTPVPEAPRRFSPALALFVLNGCLMAVFLLIFVLPRLFLSGTASPLPASLDTTSFTTLTNPQFDAQNQGRIKVGQTAPDFTLSTLDGHELALHDFAGQGVLINFWASWCVPCRAEAPGLEKAYRTYRDRNFVILGVNLSALETREDIENFVSEFNIDFPVLLDEDGEVAWDRYQLPGLPMSVFLDRQGIITHIYIGAMTSAQIEAYVADTLE